MAREDQNDKLLKKTDMKEGQYHIEEDISLETVKKTQKKITCTNSERGEGG